MAWQQIKARRLNPFGGLGPGISKSRVERVVNIYEAGVGFTVRGYMIHSLFTGVEFAMKHGRILQSFCGRRFAAGTWRVHVLADHHLQGSSKVGNVNMAWHGNVNMAWHGNVNMAWRGMLAWRDCHAHVNKRHDWA